MELAKELAGDASSTRTGCGSEPRALIDMIDAVIILQPGNYTSRSLSVIVYSVRHFALTMAFNSFLPNNHYDI
jgi:hypothetical protein